VPSLNLENKGEGEDIPMRGPRDPERVRQFRIQFEKDHLLPLKEFFVPLKPPEKWIILPSLLMNTQMKGGPIREGSMRLTSNSRR